MKRKVLYAFLVLVLSIAFTALSGCAGIGGLEGVTSVVSTPTLTPPAGTFSTSQTVTIECSTAGATIKYTTDGTEPSESSSTYSTPLTVSATQTIKAKAFKQPQIPSQIASATYTITTTTPTIQKETSFGGLTLGMSTTEVINIWGTPNRTSISGAMIQYFWTTQEATTTTEVRGTTFLNADELILIGSSRIGDSLLEIDLLDLSGEVTSKFGTPESTTMLPSLTSIWWIYNSRNIGYAISTTEKWQNRVVGLYVLDGTIYRY